MLIILSRSPWSENYGSALKIARRVAQKQNVAVAYVQDACIAATMKEFTEEVANGKIEVYALREDCETRGLTSKVNDTVKLIDYKQLVRLVMNEHESTISWTS